VAAPAVALLLLLLVVVVAGHWIQKAWKGSRE
jgi:hypothetical protein